MLGEGCASCGSTFYFNFKGTSDHQLCQCNVQSTEQEKENWGIFLYSEKSVEE